jgi:ABC-type dipeptide/oligopeptide/nickel transport system permease component
VFGRLLQGLALVLAVIVVDFALIKLAPGDPATLFIPESGASPAYLARIRRDLGLDGAPLEQLTTFIVNSARLDFGLSIRYRIPVTDLIASRIPATALLAGTGILLSSGLGVVLGVLASTRRNSRVDRLLTLLAFVGYSMPAFWLGQILLLVFSLHLNWFPAQGMVSLHRAPDPVGQIQDVAGHLVLPVIAYTLFPLTLVFRLTRGSMRDSLAADFVTAARAKGLRERDVVVRHALPNAFLPVLTVIGYNFAFLLSGSVLVESVFGWPGMGKLLSDAVLARDYPVILGVFVVSSVLVVLTNIVVDLLYVMLDPRIAEPQAGR